MDDMEAIFEEEQTVSRLALLQGKIRPDEVNFFVSLFGAERTCPSTLLKYVQLPELNMFEMDKIFIRSCYEHLTPHVQNSMEGGRGLGRRIAITGSPGIGKTVYGALLTRIYVLEKRLSVVYWERDNIYLFSWDEALVLLG